MRKQVLLISGDFSLCKRFQEAMQDDSVEVQYFPTVADALDGYIRQHYCLIIMESCLEDVGSQKLLQIMHQSMEIPILVFTDGQSSEEKIALLSLGATICVPKPVELPYFIAQSRALIRLYMGSEHSEKRYYTLSFGTELMINPTYRQVSLEGNWLNLTRKEFDLLYFLASSPGQVFTREQIYRNVWHGETDYHVDEAVKSSIKALRKKLNPASKEYIENVRGVGYRFVVR
ncbi:MULTISPECIES: response regulator transcription factor [Eubacteriales]|uniref:response regulator transcription factor n=1 Tax=Eubacteriales TaxID=186802 RepID=UPI001D09399C|nr:MULTISPECIES: response regulator transcription factor [Eubacteriales]MCB7039832.1 response regulator transcription factor [Flavonifractor plautii]MCB7049716.1 response regulator transcription factor [Intestinimonas butyriciproducens]